MNDNFQNITIIGIGLIGSSIAHAVRKYLPQAQVRGYDTDAEVRRQADALGMFTESCDTLEAAVKPADLIILCVPVGAIGTASQALAPYVRADAIISDVGGAKAAPMAAMQAALPNQIIIPAHPVAGTEQSGPTAGFASLFQNRWCIITPPEGCAPAPLLRLTHFWEVIGANVQLMSAAHHDRVLAITSHVPHLIAYTIVGTASDLEMVTESEVIKFSAGGFRDFTRIAASDPTMWRDVFLNNKEAVLEILQRFSEDLTSLQRAIRWDDGETLFNLFTRTRAVRRSIIAEGQDDSRPDFGRNHPAE